MQHRVQYGKATGRLVQIMRGIYIGAEDDADAVLFDHALRIAAYLYPNTYLCGASAERLAPTPDRRLFLSGRRNARTRLRDLEIVQTRSPIAPETETVQTADPMGELGVRRSTLRFRYLESFRRRRDRSCRVGREGFRSVGEPDRMICTLQLRDTDQTIYGSGVPARTSLVLVSNLCKC